MRTNVDIDDALMEEAKRASGLKTKRAVIEQALQMLIRSKRRKKILDLAGKIDWVGYLDELREGRFFDDSGR
jgi:Arc/MetJ family transcription regulator